MNTMNLITDKQHFEQTAESFFNIMFAKALKNGCGQIEIKGFKNGPRHISYHGSINDAVNTSFELMPARIGRIFWHKPESRRSR